MARGIGNTRLPIERRKPRCRNVALPPDVDFLRLGRALTALYVAVLTIIVVRVI